MQAARKGQTKLFRWGNSHDTKHQQVVLVLVVVVELAAPIRCVRKFGASLVSALARLLARSAAPGRRQKEDGRLQPSQKDELFKRAKRRTVGNELSSGGGRRKREENERERRRRSLPRASKWAQMSSGWRRIELSSRIGSPLFRRSPEELSSDVVFARERARERERKIKENLEELRERMLIWPERKSFPFRLSPVDQAGHKSATSVASARRIRGKGRREFLCSLQCLRKPPSAAAPDNGLQSARSQDQKLN